MMAAPLRRRARARLDRWLRGRTPSALPVRFDRHGIYVLPTRFGAFFAVLLTTMGLGALNYNNNPALLLCLVLAGAAVALAGPVGFVGLVIPHMMRMVVGPNHKRLLPASLFAGAIFLMLADLASRVILNPLELPIGVVTSFIGSVVFVFIFYRSRKGG